MLSSWSLLVCFVVSFLLLSYGFGCIYNYLSLVYITYFLIKPFSLIHSLCFYSLYWVQYGIRAKIFKPLGLLKCNGLKRRLRCRSSLAVSLLIFDFLFLLCCFCFWIIPWWQRVIIFWISSSMVSVYFLWQFHFKLLLGGARNLGIWMDKCNYLINTKRTRAI